MDIISGIGYLAMALLMFSFTLKDLNRLRIWNSFGCAVFIIYGFLINAYPILITNIFILVMNLYYLYKTYSNPEKK